MLQRLAVRTPAQECLVDITGEIREAVRSSGIDEGTALLYVPHTTCGLTTQENAAPGLQHDMLLVLRRISPRVDPAYRQIEDNSASHLQASTMGFSHFVTAVKLDLEARGELHRTTVQGRHYVTVATPALLPEERR